MFDELRADGHEPVGVRLDSGDLAYLAVQTAKLLDAAGYPDVSIVLSSDLDELNIWQILTQIGDDAERVGIDPAPIRKRLVYGVGTRLITSHGSGALNGVYKLVGIESGRSASGEIDWTPAIKVSEDPGKVPLPGRKTVWRLYDQRGTAIVDLIGLADEDPFPTDTITVHHPNRSRDEPDASDVATSPTVEVLQGLVTDVARPNRWTCSRSAAPTTSDASMQVCCASSTRTGTTCRSPTN